MASSVPFDGDQGVAEFVRDVAHHLPARRFVAREGAGHGVERRRDVGDGGSLAGDGETGGLGAAVPVDSVELVDGRLCRFGLVARSGGNTVTIRREARDDPVGQQVGDELLGVPVVRVDVGLRHRVLGPVKASRAAWSS